MISSYEKICKKNDEEIELIQDLVLKEQTL